MWSKRFFGLVVLLLSLAGQVSEVCAAQVYRAHGRVTGVADGDTFYVLIDGKSTRVRLAEVDAPEKNQPFGRKAEQSLRELVGKRDVQLFWQDIDKYGRPVVRVVVDGVNVNAEQIKRGQAWVYRQYSKDTALIRLEDEAKAAKRGLWADSQPVPPWAWRRRESTPTANRGEK